MVVESSYGRELLGLEFVRYVIRNAWKSFVFHGGKYAVGFVEQIIEIVLAVDVLTVQSDGIILGYVERTVRDDSAVYADTAVGDLIAKLGSCSQAAVCK